ncbi:MULTISPECIES: hypothetical protein [Cupriavidus]
MAQVSKLAELTLDQVTALVTWQRQKGRNWRCQLMEHYARGRDADNPPLRQLRNARLEWLQTLTPDDFGLPIHVCYGTIPCAREERATLESLGVEVGHYDDEQAVFHVRVSAGAGTELAAHSADFPLDRLTAWDERGSYPWETAIGIIGANEAVLEGAAAKVDYLIHTDQFAASGAAPLMKGSCHDTVNPLP